jgi:hypothetical protein
VAQFQQARGDDPEVRGTQPDCDSDNVQVEMLPGIEARLQPATCRDILNEIQGLEELVRDRPQVEVLREESNHGRENPWDQNRKTDQEDL